MRSSFVLVAAICIQLIKVPNCLAQSTPFVYSAVNSASYSGHPIAEGSIFTVFGFNLGPSQIVHAGSYPLQFRVGGASFDVTAGGRTFNCPMIYSSDVQAAAILPSNTPAGDAILTATYLGRISPPRAIKIASNGFGLYSIASSGAGPGVITGIDYAPKTFDRPAKTGEVLIAWGTGLGPIDGSDALAPNTTKQFANVEVFVANVPANITYAGRSGCCAGLDQIAFQVPDAALGCFAPVAIRVGGVNVSNFVSLPISSAGASCANAAPGIPTALLSKALAGEKLKVAELAIGPIRFLQGVGYSFSQGAAEQLSALLKTPVAETDVKRFIQAYRANETGTLKHILSKYGIKTNRLNRQLLQNLRAAIGLDQQGVAAAFGSFARLPDFLTQFGANIPSAGSCMVARGAPFPMSQARSSSLDAGAALTFNGPSNQKTMQRISKGQYQVSLGAGFPMTTVPPGVYTITGAGGADVGSFTALLNITDSLVWMNKAAIGTVDRTRPLTLTWSGAPAPGYVLIGGFSHTSGDSALFTCVEDARKGTFTIPSFVLSALPPTAGASATCSLLRIRFRIPFRSLALISPFLPTEAAITSPSNFANRANKSSNILD
jgi:uncharacterized protein (TIGR03437 family)